MKVWFSLTIALLFWMGFAGEAHAARGAAVLGVRSLDGEDDLERRVSHALRTSASALPELSVSDRLVSLEQMILSHGCDEPDAPCLGQIAQTLAVEVLLYGSVVAARGTHELTLHGYDTRTGKLETAEARELGAAQLQPGAVDEVVLKLLRQVLGIQTTGRLRVESNRPGATVTVDGAPRGTLDEHGAIELELPAGQHALRVTEPEVSGMTRAPATEERVLTLAASQNERLSLSLPEPPAVAPPSIAEPAPTPKRRRSWRRILGWTSVGVGAALAAATVYSWVRLGKINDDDEYTAYRQKYPQGSAGSSDVCKAAERGTLAAREPQSAGLEATARDLCSEGDKLEVLQYVFLGGAILGAGGGTYLLLTAPPRERVEEPRAVLRPRIDRSAALLEASFRF